MRRLLVIGALVALTALAWHRHTRDPVAQVQVAAARVAPLTVSWSAVGYVEAKTTEVTAPGLGRVVEVAVEEGDEVEAHQLLARLSCAIEVASVAGQRQAVAAAEARLESARASLREAERTQAPRESRAQAEFLAARARWQQAQALLESHRRTAHANVASARAQAEAARAHLQELEIGTRPEVIARAEAAVAAAEATARRAKADKERQERLLAEGAIARHVLEETQERLAQAESALQQAEETLKELRAGARPEAIAAARAQLRAAEEQVAAAEGQMIALEAEAKQVEEAAAGVEAAQAALAEVRASQARLQALRQEVRAAEAQVRQAQAAHRLARAELDERRVAADFAGVVARRFVDPGDGVSPGQVLFSLVDPSRLWVTAEVDAQDLAPVREGGWATITVAAHPGRLFRGRIVRVGSQALPQTEVRTSARILRVRISLDATPPAKRRLLKPGMEVNVSGEATLVPRAVLVPNDALLVERGETVVFTVAGERVHRRRVEAGYANERETEIRSGLREGEQVVLSGKEGLADGQRVRVISRHE